MQPHLLQLLLLKNLKKKKYKLILTGGYSHLFIKSIKQKARIDKDITMKGLLKITKLL